MYRLNEGVTLKKPRISICVLLGGMAWLLAAMPGNREFPSGRIVYAQGDWRTEFDDVCSKTQDAMVLTPEELRKLVERCDRLKPSLEKLDESQRKVYTKRLQSCRDLYNFVLESKGIK